jgi:hypothetical protein
MSMYRRPVETRRVSGKTKKTNPRSVDAIRRAAWYECEKLEVRRLFASGSEFTGGGIVDGVPQEATYTYLSADEQPVKIALWGTITAEFLFVKVNYQNNDKTVVSAVAPTTANIAADAGADLFAIYISSAKPSASISIGEETNTTTGLMGGFTSSAMNAITVNPATVNESSTTNTIIVSPTPADSGSVYLGARAYLLKSGTTPVAGPPLDGTPILSVPLTTQVGVRPVTSDGTLYAGIETAANVSLNRIFIGGQVTGRVDIGGSINTFYAGEIWTGDAGGINDGSTASGTLLRNFNVGGDLYNLISLGSMGSDAGSNTDADVLSAKPTYETGFRLSVGGHIGQVQSDSSVVGSIYAENLSTFKGLGLAQTEVETTGATPNAKSGESFFEGDANTSSSATDNEPGLNEAEAVAAGATTAQFDNDSPASAQYLGTPLSATEGHNAIQLTGVLDDSTTVNDGLDFYAVALGANQTITATLTVPTTEAGELQLGIFSPEAGYATTSSNTNLLESTYASLDSADTANKPLTFTSTDAGIYYFAIAQDTDVNFDNQRTLTELFPITYELDVTGVKNLGIGAVAAVDGLDFPGGDSFNSTTGAESAEPSVRVDNGDLGAIVSTGTATTTAGVTSTTALGPISAGNGAAPFSAQTGNIRVIQAGTIGANSVMGFLSLAPDIYAAGNVGVIRTTDTEGESNGGIMAFNTDITAVGEGTPIGGSYQLIDCAGLFAGSLVADGNIGTIRAEDIGAANLPLGNAPVYEVDANSKSDAGTIDLIDVTGTHFGTLDTGGPQITTGPDGNVRYIHVAPGATVYNDAFFGGGIDEPLVYGAGQPATLIDDSGTPFTVTPYRGQTLSGDAATPTSTSTSTASTTSGDTTTISGDVLTILTYGIEDKGGVVAISLTATAGDVGVSAASSGTSTTTTTVTTEDFTGPDAISVDTSAKGTSGSVDFGEISMVGLGSTLTFDPTTRAFTEGATAPDLVPEDDSATFSGKSPINIFDLAATTPALPSGASSGTLAGMTNVVNSTSGEIVSFHANDVETLKAASLGFAKSDTGAPVSGATVQVNAFPFHDQRNLIQIGGTLLLDGGTGDPTANAGFLAGTFGNAETIESSGPLGNILSDGTLGNILADVGGKAATGYQEGIVAPIYAATPGEFSSKTPPIDVWGNILNVNIGQGIGSSGSGNYAVTGIFADNYIGSIVNQDGSDIRGDVAAEGDAGGLAVAQSVSPITGEPIPTKGVAGTYINSIDLSDGGSLIGATILTTTEVSDALVTTGTVTIDDPNASTSPTLTDARTAIGSISLSGDGGIIGSLFIEGGINTISVAGFGIFNSHFSSLNPDVIDSINVAGYGIRYTTFAGQNSIGSIVASGTGKELPVTDYSASVRQSETGAVDDGYSGKPLDAYDDLDDALGVTRKTPTRKGATEAGVINESSITGSYELGSISSWRLENSNLSFANNIGKISVSENTEGAKITTGSLNTFASGDNVIGVKFNVAGEIKSLTAGFLNGSTYINASGPDGSVDYLATTAGMNANVDASVSIGEILVGTDLASTNITSGGNLDELYVEHSVLSGANVTVARQLGKLVIRHNLLGGSTIQARSIGTKTIGGVTNGNIIIVPTTP